MSFKSVLIGFCCYHLVLVIVLCDDDLRCNEDTFYKPYVKLYKMRRGLILKELDRSGFLDLTDTVDHYLCVNGPVIQYRDLTYEDELVVTRQMKAVANENWSVENLLRDDSLSTIVKEVNSLGESSEKNNEETEESLKKFLSEVESLFGTDGDDKDSEALVNEILKEIEATKKEIDGENDGKPGSGEKKDPTPERLHKVMEEISGAEEGLEKMIVSSEDGTQDHTTSMLETIMRELKNAKNAIAKCANGDTVNTKGEDCKSSSVVLANVIKEISTAKESIDNSGFGLRQLRTMGGLGDKNKFDLGDEDKSNILGIFNHIVEEIKGTKSAIDGGTGNAPESNKDEHDKKEGGVENTYSILLDNAMKEIFAAKAGINQYEPESEKKGGNDPTSEILDSVMKDISKAKSELLKSCDESNPDTNCEPSSIFENVMTKITNAKDAIDKHGGNHGGSNPSSDLLAKILDDIKTTKISLETKAQQKEDEPFEAYIVNKALKHIETTMENMGNNPSSNILSKVGQNIVSAVEKCTVNSTTGDFTEECFVDSEIPRVIKEISDLISTHGKDNPNDIIQQTLKETVETLKLALDKQSETNFFENPQTNSYEELPQEKAEGRRIRYRIKPPKNSSAEVMTVKSNPKVFNINKVLDDIKATEAKIDEAIQRSSGDTSVEYIVSQVLIYIENTAHSFSPDDPSLKSLARVGQKLVTAVDKCSIDDNPKTCYINKEIPKVIDVVNKIMDVDANPDLDIQTEMVLTSVLSSLNMMMDNKDDDSMERRFGRASRKTSNAIKGGRHIIARKKRQKRSTPPRKVAVYKDAELAVYNHECFVINHATRQVFMSTKATVSTMTLTRSMQTVGKKTFGITLIGDENDYRNTEIYQFMDKSFEEVVSGVSLNGGSSFVTVGKMNSWCHKDSKQELKVHPDSNSPGEVCRRGGGNTEYDAIFPPGSDKIKYNWKICDRIARTGNVTHGITVYEHFATMDKSKLTGPGSPGVKHPPPAVPAFIPGFLLPGAYYPTPPIDTNITSVPNKTVEVYPDPTCKNISGSGRVSSKLKCTFDTDHCIPLPVYDSVACDSLGNLTDPCVYINHVMNLTAPNPVVDDIQWKNRILNLIDSIFNHICKKVNPRMPPSVSRVIMYYLNLQHLNNPTLPRTRRDTWNFLESELTRCNENAQEMVFTWHSGSKLSVQSKKKRRKRQVGSNIGRPNDFLMRFNAEDAVDALLRGHRAPQVGTGTGGTGTGTGTGTGGTGTGTGGTGTGTGGTGTGTGGTGTGGTGTGTGGTGTGTGGTGTGTGTGGTGTGGGAAGGVPMPPVVNRPVHAIFEEQLDPDMYIYPENVSVHMFQKDSNGRRKRQATGKANYGAAIPLYYFEDAAELNNDLSIPIDLHFKVFGTVAGYCNLFYVSRKSETFPRLYSSYYEDIFSIMDQIWLRPRDNSVMKFLFSEYLTEPVTRWIDSCLEASYLVSSSPTYRPPRPLIITEMSNVVANYFIDEPPHVINNKRNNVTSPTK